jgi:hypothetical protein
LVDGRERRALLWRTKSSPTGPEHLVALVAVIGRVFDDLHHAGTFQIDPPANDPVPLAG